MVADTCRCCHSVNFKVSGCLFKIQFYVPLSSPIFRQPSDWYEDEVRLDY